MLQSWGTDQREDDMLHDFDLDPAYRVIGMRVADETAAALASSSSDAGITAASLIAMQSNEKVFYEQTLNVSASSSSSSASATTATKRWVMNYIDRNPNHRAARRARDAVITAMFHTNQQQQPQQQQPQQQQVPQQQHLIDRLQMTLLGLVRLDGFDE